jgi:CBS domain containing-hemolysin-like protein
MDSILGVLAVFLLVMANAFFVAAEFSLVGVRRTRIEQLAQEGNAAAKSAQHAISQLDSYIAATQLGITLASLGLGWIGEPAIGHLFDPLLRLLPAEWASTVGHSLSIAIAFALVTMLHIILGELTPKAIALQRPETVALFVVRPTTLFLVIFRPVIRAMNSTGNWIVRLLGFEPASEHSNVHSPEELEMLVHSSREAGLLSETEERLLRRVFDFSDVQMRQVMRPRTEVDAVAVDTPLPELLQLISARHHSRYPVYQGTMDTVVGILHAKDLLDAIAAQPQLLTTDPASFDLLSILRKPLFIPQTTGVDGVLEQMQRSKTHIAIVIDEYGGMDGIATMEDILEELVGEVQDEFDTEANPIETEGDMTLVDGLVSLDDVSERFGEPGGSKAISTTIGGYVAERLDRIPVLGDTVPFGDYDLRVEEMDGMRASKVSFIKRPVEQSPEGESEESPPA